LRWSSNLCRIRLRSVPLDIARHANRASSYSYDAEEPRPSIRLLQLHQDGFTSSQPPCDHSLHIHLNCAVVHITMETVLIPQATLIFILWSLSSLNIWRTQKTCEP
jgi:hypothetical protein